MAGMWIIQVDIKDDVGYSKYLDQSSKVVPRFDGEFIARGGRYQQKEGKERPRNVVVRFPTYERAVEAYESDEYQAIVGLAKDSADRSFTIVEVDD